ncbi:MAG: cytidine deaminase [Candidatus Actinomarinales bacterium]|nr:MAG: cytidine deaminase [Candidatus Actinomarinales bacterium]|tara:strand:+ start:4456 stop:4845 length:390 start_codon:yes stop_codon:yes gene_type:complete
MIDIDDKLAKLAKEAGEKAYAPYSNFRVGAALITDSGNIYTGCNIENAAYPATVCGEDVAVFKAISEGESKIDTIAVACIDAKSDTALFPCGVSRQRLSEFNTDSVIVVDKKGYKKYSFSEILPFDFKF